MTIVNRERESKTIVMSYKRFCSNALRIVVRPKRRTKL